MQNKLDKSTFKLKLYTFYTFSLIFCILNMIEAVLFVEYFIFESVVSEDSRYKSDCRHVQIKH